MMIRISQQTRKGIRLLTVGVSLLIFALGVFGQDKSGNIGVDSTWSNTSQQRNSRLELADREQYVVRHIYVAGNTRTTDREIRTQLVQGFRLGDIFNRTALEKSIKQISKIRSLQPVTVDDIDVRIDDKEKHVEFTINVREKQKEQL